jgi:hypothetical protein
MEVGRCGRKEKVKGKKVQEKRKWRSMGKGRVSGQWKGEGKVQGKGYGKV